MFTYFVYLEIKIENGNLKSNTIMTIDKKVIKIEYLVPFIYYFTSNIYKPY